jgi:hypothetical protein
MSWVLNTMSLRAYAMQASAVLLAQASALGPLILCVGVHEA